MLRTFYECIMDFLSLIGFYNDDYNTFNSTNTPFISSLILGLLTKYFISLLGHRPSVYHLWEMTD